MTEYVEKLEHIRMNNEGGPNSAVGLMMKAIGNNERPPLSQRAGAGGETPH
jgi:hypothetical protein